MCSNKTYPGITIDTLSDKSIWTYDPEVIKTKDRLQYCSVMDKQRVI